MANSQNVPTVWQEDLPKIGIRPTIDGRLGGVRESLEDQTQALAHSVQELLTENLRYPNGEPVRCVVAKPCIGGCVYWSRSFKYYAGRIHAIR